MRRRKKIQRIQRVLIALMMLSLFWTFQILGGVDDDDPITSSSSSSSELSQQKKHFIKLFNTPPINKKIDDVVNVNKIGKTIIVAFANYNFRSVAVIWYERMTKLGYDTHVIVATDQPMVEFLRYHTNFRYEISLREEVEEEEKEQQQKQQQQPSNDKNNNNNNEEFKKKKKVNNRQQQRKNQKESHTILKLLMAVRWKFLQEKLSQGIHVLLTDVDNIFTRYIDIEQEFTNHDPSIDVYMAYATKYPLRIYKKQGFVVCSGMSWWRASSSKKASTSSGGGGISTTTTTSSNNTSSIQSFSQIMHDQCGKMCDDQVVLNTLLVGPKVGMNWYWTEEAINSRITAPDPTTTSNTTTNNNTIIITEQQQNNNNDDDDYHDMMARIIGIPTIGIMGVSNVTKQKIHIWDRNFAYRGPIIQSQCPPSNVNWVAMPTITTTKSRSTAWESKIQSFNDWDRICGTQTHTHS